MKLLMLKKEAENNFLPFILQPVVVDLRYLKYKGLHLQVSKISGLENKRMSPVPFQKKIKKVWVIFCLCCGPNKMIKRLNWLGSHSKIYQKIGIQKLI